jgi:hypothetical protein
MATSKENFLFKHFLKVAKFFPYSFITMKFCVLLSTNSYTGQTFGIPFFLKNIIYLAIISTLQIQIGVFFLIYLPFLLLMLLFLPFSNH